MKDLFRLRLNSWELDWRKIMGRNRLHHGYCWLAPGNREQKSNKYFRRLKSGTMGVPMKLITALWLFYTFSDYVSLPPRCVALSTHTNCPINEPFSITRESDNGTFDFCELLRAPTFCTNRLLSGAWVSEENRKLDHQHLAPLKSLEFWRLFKMNKNDCEKEAKKTRKLLRVEWLWVRGSRNCDVKRRTISWE